MLYRTTNTPGKANAFQERVSRCMSGDGCPVSLPSASLLRLFHARGWAPRQKYSSFALVLITWMLGALRSDLCASLLTGVCSLH